MKSYVVDASVAAAWFLSPKQEPLSAQAVSILEAFLRRQAELIAPDLLHPELGHVLCKAVRAKRISRESADDSIEAFLNLPITIAPMRDHVREATYLAHSTGCSVYDGIYVALAIASGYPLLTADERLANALSPRFPVHWLGLL